MGTRRGHWPEHTAREPAPTDLKEGRGKEKCVEGEGLRRISNWLPSSKTEPKPRKLRQ